VVSVTELFEVISFAVRSFKVNRQAKAIREPEKLNEIYEEWNKRSDEVVSVTELFEVIS